MRQSIRKAAAILELLPDRLPSHAMAKRRASDPWQDAESALPAGWGLRGVVRGPREVDPSIRGSGWVAWARGPDGERLEGKADTPAAALAELTTELRALDS
jgi:hypothetical protein